MDKMKLSKKNSFSDKEEKHKPEYEGLPVLMKNGKKIQIERLKKVALYLKELQVKKFTGYIKVNFSQGSIAKIEKFEEVLKK